MVAGGYTGKLLKVHWYSDIQWSLPGTLGHTIFLIKFNTKKLKIYHTILQSQFQH